MMMMNSNHHHASDSIANNVLFLPEYNPQTIMNYYSCGIQTGRCSNPLVKNLIEKPKNHLSAIGWTFFYVSKKTGTRELRYKAPSGRVYVSLRTACECAIKNQDQSKKPNVDSFDQIVGFKKKFESFSFKSERFSCNRPMKKIQDVKRLMVTGKKVAQKAKVSSTKTCRVLGSLIENNVVERGSRVSYLSRKDGRAMATGQVYEDGLSAQLKFESVLLADDKSTKSVVTDVKSTKSSDYVRGTNDEYCSFCYGGGELLLCDSCTSSFHSTCIGLDCVPNSDLWFCPACACQMCHQGQPSNLTKEGDSKVYDLFKCAQCEHHFHINYIDKLGFEVCADDAKWFCTVNCERIYLGLMEIRGKEVSLKGGNVSWSLLKYDENDTDVYELKKSYSKLMKALDVMHECFVPVKHPLSDKDVIEDVIFSRATKRSNFEGFYTAVLEKNDEIITVVTLRIHGYKVAEIPFVATTFRYRRLGMCRILMNEVERMIRKLGVERIVLHASPEKISTWTRSFGFREMKDIERRDLVKCKFLEFLGTKKYLKKLKKM
nr:zinc finger, RING/FYVE/PHD-type, acyl-CoA N-acyltransferase, Jas TPL-binding domain protein [Tanacetum cinerariifolium]